MHETYHFTLVLADIEDFTDEMANRLYKAGCNDACLSSSEGVVTLDFSRQGLSLEHAIATAVRCVRRAGLEVAGDPIVGVN